MFDKVIAPILVYASEVWGAYTILPSKSLTQDNTQGYWMYTIEKFYIAFLKYCLGVHRKACNVAVFGELGSTPLSLKVMNLVCKNWFRIVNSDKNSLLYDTYLCNVELSHKNQSIWLNSVKGILQEAGLRELWNNQGNASGLFPTFILKQNIYNKFRLQWNNEILNCDNEESKLRTYTIF